jgi:ribonuclease HI
MSGRQTQRIAGAPRLIVHVDGGARGNPGPAAIGVVISAPDGTVIEELAERIGSATNNVAEYRALLRGLERARMLGAREVELVNDSELVARQLTGAYRVRHPAMRPLFLEAMAALRGFDRWQIRSVPRAQNARADALVNEALDGGGRPPPNDAPDGSGPPPPNGGPDGSGRPPPNGGPDGSDRLPSAGGGGRV